MKDIESVISKEKIKYLEPMSKHTTMKVGGNADIMVFPTNVDEIRDVINYANKNNINYYILGNGSNILVSDLGVDGIVIKLSQNFRDVKINDECITVLSRTFIT